MGKLHFNFFISKKSKWEYFFYIFVLALIGLLIHILLSGQAFIHYSSMNKNELKTAFELYKNTALPTKISDFLGIFWGNCRTMLILILLPIIVYWCIILIFYVNNRIIVISPKIMKPLLYISIIFFGYNSFTRLYPRYFTYPFTIFYTHYVYHGIIEILTFFICAVWSLSNLDKMDDDMCVKPPLSWLSRVKNSFINSIYPIIFGLIFLALAAYIETQITPYLILNSYIPYIG